jgi:hypothetical protein
MKARHLSVFDIVLWLFACICGGSSILSGQGSQTIQFPTPPNSGVIGTQVGPISTYVKTVTMSSAANVQRFGLVYSEFRGVISGVGWGGFDGGSTFRACHYDYELPFVLRVPPAWSGGLVIYRGQTASLAEWEAGEATYKSRNWARVNHEAADRYASDVALHPHRRWAYFAANENPVAPGGLHNTLLRTSTGCVAGTPTATGRDITIARDHALLVQHLLKMLTNREVTLTLGVGFSAGGQQYFNLNAGADTFGRAAGSPTLVGDNRRVPYDKSSGRIFDGFLAIDPPIIGNQRIPAASLFSLSAPTIFLSGDSNRIFRFIPAQIAEFAGAGLDAQTWTRFYTVRNLPNVPTDFSLSMIRGNIDWADPAFPGYYQGGGEQLKPLTAALLDALAAWASKGIAPPASIFNGEVKTSPDRIEFYRTSSPVTTLPYADDVTLDSYQSAAPVTPNAVQRTGWIVTRNILGGAVGSIVLSETGCRRGGLNFSEAGVLDTNFRSFDETTFLLRWSSQAAYQSCRVELSDTLAAAGFYDPDVVTIDVDPQHFPNLIDLPPQARVSVAIFSSARFDATEVVPSSVRLASVSMQGIADDPGFVFSNVMDFNGDERLDLIVEFRRDRLQLNTEDIIVDLWGSTRSGGQFTGSDVVKVVR